MKKIVCIVTSALCLLAISCGEEVLDKQNTDQQTTQTYFKDTNEIRSALTSAYGILQSTNLFSRERFFLHDLRSDEMAAGGGQLEAPRGQILNGSHDPSNPIITGIWTTLYRLIHRANTVIEYAPEAQFGDASLRDRFIAEAKFLRGFAYYEIYTLWGGAPIYETFATSIFGSAPRASAADVKALVIRDLNDAINVLPNSYSGADLGRASKIAAQTLLAKLYMFDGQYSEAKPLLDAVRTYGETTFGNPLMNNYFDNFTEESEYNKESIWEISYNSGGGYNWDGDGNGNGPTESWIRSQEYSAVAWRNLIPSDKLLAEYEQNDPRLRDTFWFIGDKFGDPANPVTLTENRVQGNASNFRGTPTKVSWKKYSIMYKRDPGGFFDQIGINYRVMRYADVYLMLAEAENEVGSAALAVQYLNKTRSRQSVNMPLYPTAEFPTGSKDQIMKAIMHERMIELAGEETRNFDILRWRKNGKFGANTYPEPISYFQANRYELLPIPLQELDANPNIDQSHQNPGY
jgi:starch-binding outer membrane protein, SusD/RagB family